jgi:hypothetical protein
MTDLNQIEMDTPEYFIERLRKAIEDPADKRVFVMKRSDKIRVEVTQGTSVVEDVEFPFKNEGFDEYEINPSQLHQKFEGPIKEENVREIFRNPKR